MKKSLLFLSLIASFTTLNAQWTAQATGFNELPVVVGKSIIDGTTDSYYYTRNISWNEYKNTGTTEQNNVVLKASALPESFVMTVTLRT